MGRTIAEAIDRLPADRRAKIETRAAELIAEELSLQELRKAMRLTEAELARRLGVRQDTISRAEQRADMPMSTLQSYVKAMGGQLALVAELPNRPPVRIKSFRMLAGDGDNTGETGPHSHPRAMRLDPVSRSVRDQAGSTLTTNRRPSAASAASIWSSPVSW